MPLYPYRDTHPSIDETVLIAPGVRIVGDVTIGAHSSIWFNAVVRGDSGSVRVGARVNIQDGAVLHTSPGSPCVVGDDCTIGHLAIVHACRIGRSCLIGMGAVVLSGAEIGEESLVAAGALVPERRIYPPRSLLAGSPVRRLRTLSDEEVERLISPTAANYLVYAADYSRFGLPVDARASREGPSGEGPPEEEAPGPLSPSGG